jgi:hypothetical protein
MTFADRHAAEEQKKANRAAHAMGRVLPAELRKPLECDTRPLAAQLKETVRISESQNVQWYDVNMRMLSRVFQRDVGK